MEDKYEKEWALNNGGGNGKGHDKKSHEQSAQMRRAHRRRAAAKTALLLPVTEAPALLLSEIAAAE